MAGDTRMSMAINIYYAGRGNAAKEFASEMISSGIVSGVRQKKGNLNMNIFCLLTIKKRFF